MSEHQPHKKKKNILIIGKGYIAKYIIKDTKKKFNTIFISRKKFSIKKKINNIDVILHTIGLNRHASELKKKEAISVKKKYTQEIIKFAKLNKISKIIYFSSSLVYAKNIQGKIDENTKCKNKESYAKHHLFAENLLKKYSGNDLKIIILRMGNVFGINNYQNNDNIYGINKMILTAIRDKEVDVNFGKLEKNIIPIDHVIKIIPKLKFTQNFKILNIYFKTLNLEEIAKLISKRIKYLFNHRIKVNILKNGKSRKKLNFKSIYLKEKIYKKLIVKQIDGSLKIINKINIL